MPQVPPESRWNGPNTDCGQPQDCWHAADRSSTEVEVSAMMHGIVLGLQPASVVETGCYRGQTTYSMARALHINGRGRVLALDTDRACAAAARQLCAGLPVDVRQADARAYVYPCNVDLAFIDTGDPGDRLQDLQALLPYLTPFSVVVFHDTGSQFGLRVKLDYWAHYHGHHVVFLPTARGVGILTRGPAGW